MRSMPTRLRGSVRCVADTPTSSSAMSDDPPTANRLRRSWDPTARQQRQLAGVLSTLASDAHAPTAVRDPARAMDAHVRDSLAALELDAVRAAGAIADVGSGAGFPGLALAIALPSAEIRLI